MKTKRPMTAEELEFNRKLGLGRYLPAEENREKGAHTPGPWEIHATGTKVYASEIESEESSEYT